MIGVKATIQFDCSAVKKAVRAGNIESLGHAGASVRLVARRSIRRAKGPSAPGHPPHTRLGRLRESILFAVENASQCVVIGPDASIADQVGAAHEFGGHYKKESFDRRPFMAPALEAVRNRLPAHWADSVKK
jgi:hypothetical protein